MSVPLIVRLEDASGYWTTVDVHRLPYDKDLGGHLVSNGNTWNRMPFFDTGTFDGAGRPILRAKTCCVGASPNHDRSLDRIYKPDGWFAPEPTS